ncbi:ribose 5-phosphate isomerase B [Dysgonomonas sp. 520]|uniref:ribose 5-phosphate isomerase B n=1 Tax=Dysgonomonas sp. 520 TaxID=2302931 RepID=UPI0013D57A6E|nr:ribose 5-phosphate isomerase B [Dysgonomonas sp. 520]NDW09121.1 ribose 5-phosphate isomerase B [Dysgonomonas sp. 520]
MTNSLFSQSEKPIGICSDHAGFEMKSYIISLFEEKGIAYKDFGTHSPESTDYTDYAHPLAIAVENNECYPGIALCGTGNGMNMALNKHQGIRSALCWNDEIAKLVRAHNNANVLVLPARFITNDEMYNILVAFLNTPFEGGRHQRRIEKIPCR